MEGNVSINYSKISKFLIVSVSIHNLLKIGLPQLWYAKYTNAIDLIK